MAMNVDKLTNEIYAARKIVISPDVDPIQDSVTKSKIYSRLKQDSKAIAETVIAHIKQNMEVEINPVDIAVLTGISVVTYGSATTQSGATTAEGQANGTAKGSKGRIK